MLAYFTEMTFMLGFSAEQAGSWSFCTGRRSVFPGLAHAGNPFVSRTLLDSPRSACVAVTSKDPL